MTNRFNLLSQQFLQKDFSNCSVEELQQLSQQYPFFAPAQFLLLKKLQEENSPEFSQQLQKAVLYHHNLLTFDLLINEHEIETTFPSEIISPSIEAPISVQYESLNSPLSNHQETEISLIKQQSEEQPEEKFPDLEVKTASFSQSAEVEIIDQPVSETPKTDLPVKETMPPADISLSFEPFHTVDYFASVGIKLSQEDIGKDNFGRQLKSFTEWLKTMKRLPAAEQLKKLDPHAVEKVENIAAHSLDNSEILTEAMAEVWVKQGKLEKAIEVYNKLSLLNPSKRAYFAAKLENLKKAI